MSRLRVLIATHEFSPVQGGECAVGWELGTRLAAYHDVTVLCASGPQHRPHAYRNAVSEYLDNHGPIEGLSILFVDPSPLAARYARINRLLFDVTDGAGFRPLFYGALNAWNRSAADLVRRRGAERFDLVHQLTPVGFRTPGFMWQLGIPFFWGPIGGLHKVPTSFARWLGWRSWLFESTRSLANELQKRNMRVRAAAARASLVWTVTEQERDMVEAISGRHNTEMLSENATAESTEAAGQAYEGDRPLRICWSGRHDAPKALPILLQALARSRMRDHFLLDVLGVGPETSRWHSVGEKLGLHNVKWHGWLPREDAQAVLGQADVLVHTSVREATGNVIMEAMSRGKPVVCHDACGMALAVSDDCGIKIPLATPNASIEGFRRAIELLERDVATWKKLSAGARRRSLLLTWDAKTRRISDGYLQHCSEG